MVFLVWHWFKPCPLWVHQFIRVSQVGRNRQVRCLSTIWLTWSLVTCSGNNMSIIWAIWRPSLSFICLSIFLSRKVGMWAAGGLCCGHWLIALPWDMAAVTTARAMLSQGVQDFLQRHGLIKSCMWMVRGRAGWFGTFLVDHMWSSQDSGNRLFLGWVEHAWGHLALLLQLTPGPLLTSGGLLPFLASWDKALG